MNHASFRIEECLSFAWSAWKRDAGTYLFITVLLALADVAFNAVLGAVHMPFFFAAHFVIGSLVSGLFSGSLIAVAERGARGETPRLEHALAPFRERQGDYLIVGLALSAGVILFGIGIFITAVLFMFAPLLVVRGAGYEAALRASKDLVLAKLSDVAALFVVLAILNFVGMIACGIGVLVTAPLSALALVRAHALLTGTDSAASTPSLPAA